MNGRIHSIESFGTVDGPGVRLVVFTQGCPMRCLYCHNPDTWETNAGKIISDDEIVEQFEKNRAYYKNGGITVTGGEPLLQADFVASLFEKAAQRGIHTCLDTSGATFDPKRPDKYDKLLKNTNLVLLDIKHMNSQKHKELTGFDNFRILEFARLLDKKHIPVWIRHVVVPGYTLDEKWLSELGVFLASLSNIKALEILPYHTMGEEKYKELNIPYPLKGVRAANKDDAAKAKKIILEAYKKALSEKNRE